MDRSRSRPSRWVLATDVLAVLAFIPLARGAGWPWAKQFKMYESKLANSSSQEGRF